MVEKKFSQEEVNKIISFRVKRENDRLTKEFEKTLKRCMASVHLTLYEELRSLKKEFEAETKDTLMSNFIENSFIQ